MPEDKQYPLFYEGIMDALNKMVNGNPKGLSLKQIAMTLWPSRNSDTARSVFSRTLNEETDVHLNPEEVVRTMHIADAPEHIIYFLCDEFGFERPLRKDKESFKRDVKSELKGVMNQLRIITKKIESLENGK